MKKFALLLTVVSALATFSAAAIAAEPMKPMDAAAPQMEDKKMEKKKMVKKVKKAKKPEKEMKADGEMKKEMKEAAPAMK
ncbi:hypothetical protein [Trichlorobacter lovleyi]|uniref:Pentapeptide MXKDX repeat protein n=1 Tax=Trichlorobacter lovleyi (strain ATCC BAA-1151 / DSM 17278 / SZ) TaxID=398767 RepID=B3E3U0_TRIL1|nr:hypothetical protein [Trichlorobacter lovleyi]ACD94354.1 conserved hypothetical protein [Trichlorobacter lovleyi SZ]